MAEVVQSNTKFESTQLSEGVFEVKQVAVEAPTELNSGNRKAFNFDVKIFSVHGYVDIDDKEIAAWPSVAGFQIGDGWKAGFSSGLQIQLVLAVYNGSVRFYVEGQTLLMNLHLKPLLPWGDSVNYTGQIFTF
ncbi:hypothetical protein ACN47E_008328 [Coniothyrium glycines]